MRGAVAVAVCALALLTPSSAGAAEKAIWGPITLPNGQSAFPTYRAAGVDTLQMQLDVASLAPTRPANPADPRDPAYRWPAEIDRAIAGASASGIHVALLLSGSPPWTNGGAGRLTAPDPDTWAAIVGAAARRYPSVRRWMIWGEPNRDDRFLPNVTDSPVGPRVYARVLDASYGALKRASSANIVIGGMTWTGGTVKPAQFLRYMRLPSGKPPRLDWFGHNPFPFRFPDIRELAIQGGWRDISDLDTFGKELKATYGSRVKFWLSEFTVQSGKGSREFALSVSEADQARWLTAAFRIADDSPQVAGLGWLGLLDEPEARGSANRGLLNASGAAKPALAAFRAAPSARLTPAVRVGKRVRTNTLRGHGLTVKVRPRAGGRLQIELLSGSRRVARLSRVARAGRLTTLRLRAPRARRGSLTLRVESTGGSSVQRTVRAR